MAISLEMMRSELTSVLVDTPPGVPVASRLCSACVGLFGVDGAAVSFVDQGASRGTFGSSSETSRRLDEYQFTFGEGPCLDAVASVEPVLVPDLDSPKETRWPAFAGAVLDEGVRGVFAVPILLKSMCVGALDLFREAPGPLEGDQLRGALLAAELVSMPLLDLLHHDDQDDPFDGLEDRWGRSLEMDRLEVHQATGMLIAQLQVGPEEALLRLRAHAIATGQTASEVAWAIIERRLVLDRDDQDGTGKGSR